MGRGATVPLVLVLAAAPSVHAGDIPKAVVVLEGLNATLPDQVPEAAPPRFVLLEDGQVFVGGTSRLAAGRLAKAEAKEIEARVVGVRQLPGFGASVTLGAGPQRYRLRLRKGGAQDITVAGDPAEAPANLTPLATLLESMLRFDHPSLRPYRPGAYAVPAREGKLIGGCRPWMLPEPLAQSVFAPREVPARGHGDWPTGAVPASVCVEDKHYVVTFRPLLPGEHP